MMFFLLTTRLLQFANIHIDLYNFHSIGDFAGIQMPYVPALLVNPVIASEAGPMF